MRAVALFGLITLLSFGCGKKPKDEDKKAPTRKKVVKVPTPKEFRPLVEALFEELKKGDLKAVLARFHEGLKQKLPLPKFEALWKRVQKYAGAFKGVRSIKKRRRAQYTVYTVVGDFTKLPWRFVLTFNAKGMVINFSHRPLKVAPPKNPLPAPPMKKKK